MKVQLIYLKVQGSGDPRINLPPEYNNIHRRFVQTYRQFKPEAKHQLLVISSNGEKDSDTQHTFEGLEADFSYYNGHGRDIGAFQSVTRTLDSDLVICCGSQVYFWREGWLERILEAFNRYGEGVYAPMASFELSPHLRTCCFAYSPKLMRRYPFTIINQMDGYEFEHGTKNFSRWAIEHGYPTMMITWNAEYDLTNWRNPMNIFRRGDQTNCLVWDRHTDLYRDADADEKRNLAIKADGFPGIS